jgi:hypothetical protein
MNRKGAVVAAGSVSVMLLLGSTAFAVGSGAFATKPVDRVGTFQSIQAALVKRAGPTSSPTAAATATAAAGSTRPEPPEPSTDPTNTGATTGTISLPTSAPGAAPTIAPGGVPSSTPVTEGAHAGVTVVSGPPATTARHASGTSAHHPDDDWRNDPPERPHPASDD